VQGSTQQAHHGDKQPQAGQINDIKAAETGKKQTNDKIYEISL